MNPFLFSVVLTLICVIMGNVLIASGILGFAETRYDEEGNPWLVNPNQVRSQIGTFSAGWWAGAIFMLLVLLIF